MGGEKASLSKFCHTYSTLITLDTVMPYLKEIQKTHRYIIINMVAILMRSAKLATLGLLKIKVF